MKLCECGCGRPAPIARRTNAVKGHVKDEPIRFIQGHSGGNGSEIGATKVDEQGYVVVFLPGHPHANLKGWALEHVLVASRALGKVLPRGVVVHHVNEVKTENQPTNLVICENAGYHGLLHKRMEARAILKAGEKRCPKCDTVKLLAYFYVDARWLTGTSSWCKARWLTGTSSWCKACCCAAMDERRAS